MTAQDALVVKYRNGNSSIAQIADVEEIVFTTYGEAIGDMPSEVSRGLKAYYTFDNANLNDSQDNYPGSLNGGTFIYDTPSGVGRSLMLKQQQYVTIGSSVLDNNKNYSVSFWIKDFGAGCVVKTIKNNLYTGPTVLFTEEQTLAYYTGQSNYSGSSLTFAPNFANMQIGQWIMVTLVTEDAGDYNHLKTILYINGQKADAGTSVNTDAYGGSSMTIGGQERNGNWAAPMRIDNLRLYSVALTDDEVADIYKRELMPAPLSVIPTELSFATDVYEQEVVLTNNTPQPLDFSVTDDLGVLKFIPTKSFVPARGTQTITVSVLDRDNVEAFMKGKMTIVCNGEHHSVSVQIRKGKNAANNGPEVTRGLAAYYTFDNENTNNIMNDLYPGLLTGGKFVSDTPDGTGKALLLNAKDYITIGSAPLDTKKNYSVSFWIKDFGSGSPLHTMKNPKYFTGPTVTFTEEMKIRYYTGQSNYSNSSVMFNTDFTSYQVGKWMMITLVTEDYGDNNRVRTSLYVNGRKADAGTSVFESATGALRTEIGGDWSTNTSKNIWSDPMKLDNIRLYSVALSDEEVAEIYAVESK
jgi:hypothetical protein